MRLVLYFMIESSHRNSNAGIAPPIWTSAGSQPEAEPTYRAGFRFGQGRKTLGPRFAVGGWACMPGSSL